VKFVAFLASEIYNRFC